MRLRPCLLAVILLFFRVLSFAQTDTTFWFAAPDLQQAHGDRPILLRLSTGAAAATVTVTQPANPSFVPVTANIAANSSQSLDLTPYISMIENAAVNTIDNKGLKITSTAMVSCYYDIAHGYNGDIYAMKGANGLGFKFTLPFQMSFQSRGLPDYTCSFTIVASENNTTVTITPKNDLLGHPAGTAFSVLLNKGQTYTCQALTNTPSLRPGGTVVIASKPVAISTKDDSIFYPNQGCADTAGDQLIPDCNAGTSFVISRGQLNGPDYFFVFAINDNTIVSVNGSPLATINAGNYYTGTLAAQSCFVQSSSPVHVFHLTGFGCELGGAVVPAVDNEGSSFIGVTRAATSPFYINVITAAANIGAFTVNALSTVLQASDFLPVPGTNFNWMAARVPITTAVAGAGQNIRIQNAIGKFHLGVIHGDVSSTTRYGFFSDFERVNINLSPYDTFYCKGSDIIITGSATGATDFQWTGPNGFTSTGPELHLINFQLANQGYYTLSATSSRCGYIERKIWLGVQLPVADFLNPASQCFNGNSFEFTSTATVNTGDITGFSWNFGDGNTAQGQLVTHSYASSGTYTVKLVATTNRSCRDSIEKLITVHPSPVATTTVNSTASCLRGNSFNFQGSATVSNPATIASQVWNFGDGNNAATPTATHSYTLAGSYTVSYIVTTDNNCKDTAEQTIVVHPQPAADYTTPASQCFANNSFGFNGSALIFGGTIAEYYWDFGDGNSASTLNTLHAYAAPGNYTVKFRIASDQGCKDSLEHTINVFADPSTTIVSGGPLNYCADRTLTLNSTNQPGSGNIDLYQWYLNTGVIAGANAASWTVAQSGSYTLEVRNSNGCRKTSAPVDVTIYPLPIGILNTPTTTNICEGGSVTLTATGGNTYQWFLNTNPLPGITGSTLTATQPGIYTVGLISAEGCRKPATGTVTLVLIQKPLADFSHNAYCAWVLTPFNNLSVVTNSGPVTWNWNFGDGGVSTSFAPSHTYQQAGSFPVTLVTTPTLCPNLAMSITKNLTIEARRNDMRYPIRNVVKNQRVNLQARTFGINYSWSPGTGLSATDISNPVFRYDQSMEYLITIRTQSSCVTVDTLPLRVFNSIDILVPTGFTPNGDGLNDKLDFFLIGIEQFNYLRIHNRWGQQVFTTNTDKQFWDGNFNGVKQPSDVYVWYAEGVGFDGNKVFRKGLVTLIRK